MSIVRLLIDDWVFEVDMPRTMEYSAKEAAEHCTCPYCRNFYTSVDQTYPQMRPFLGRFGIDIEAPDELLPYYPPTDCVLYYAVGGRIVVQGKGPIFVNGLRIFPEPAEEAMVNTFIEGSRFFIHTDMMHLSWVLDEPMEDVQSPANDPGLVSNLLQKLRRKVPDDQSIS